MLLLMEFFGGTYGIEEKKQTCILNNKSLVFQAAMRTKCKGAKEVYILCAWLWSVKLCQSVATTAAIAAEKPCNEGNQNQCRQNSINVCAFFLLIEHYTFIDIIHI